MYGRLVRNNGLPHLPKIHFRPHSMGRLHKSKQCNQGGIDEKRGNTFMGLSGCLRGLSLPGVSPQYL